MCSFCKKKFIYLGHSISYSGIRPNPEKVREIKEIP